MYYPAAQILGFWSEDLTSKAKKRDTAFANRWELVAR